MTLDTMRELGAELQHIREEKTYLQRLDNEDSPAIQQELQRWDQVLNSIVGEEALLEDIYEGYEPE